MGTFHSTRRFLVATFASTLALAACAQQGDPATGVTETVQTEIRSGHAECTLHRRQECENRELLHRYHLEVWEEGHFDRAANYLGPGFTAHSLPILPGGQV